MIHRQGATGYLRKKKQLEVLEIVKSYPMEPLPCVCGADDDEQIADRDRYGFPITVKICRNCGLVRTDPYFPEEVLSEFYEGPYRDLDDNLGTFEDVFHHEQAQAQSVLSIWAPVTGTKIGHKICEIGCGAGGLLSFFKDLGHDVMGIDSGAIALYGRSRGIDIREEWPEEYDADIVVMLQVFEHFRDPVGMLRKVRKLVKPDGMLMINVPGIYLIPHTYRYDLQRYLVLTHPFHYTRDTLLCVAKRAGWHMAVGTEAVTGVFELGAEEESIPDDKADTVLRFLSYQEQMFEIMKDHDPAILVAMKKTKAGKEMYERMTREHPNDRA